MPSQSSSLWWLRHGQESDGFNHFLNAMGKLRVPKRDEYLKLVADAQAGNFDARNQLIERNLRLVVDIAKSFRWSGLPLEDLVDEGVFGLARAIEKFDVSRGTEFSTCATEWIRASINRAIENTGRPIRIPTHVHASWQQIRRLEYRLAAQLGREATETELLKALREQIAKTSREAPSQIELRAKEKLTTVRNAFRLETVSLEQENEDDETIDLDYLVKLSEPGIDVQIIERDERLEQVRIVRDRLAELAAPKHNAIELRHGFDGLDHDRSLDEVARIQGVSKQAAHQRYRTGIEILRKNDNGILAELNAAIA